MPGRLLPPLLLAIVSTCIARDVSASQLPSASLLHRPSALPTSNALAAASPRNQQRESMAAHLRELCTGLDASIDPEALATKVCDQLPAAGATEEQITELMAETAAYQASMHPDFARLAARVAVSRLHARTDASVLSVLRTMRHHCHNGEPAPLVSEQLLADAEALAPALEAALQHERDFDYDYFGLRTLQRSYLHKDDHGQPIERPQHMLMRVALCVHGRNEAAVLKAYELMAAGMYTHATPTLFNAGSPRPQLCSCFLLTAKADSIAGIFDTLRQCALISRDAGGIGVSVSHIRAANSYIRSSGGRSSGLVPMLRVFDATARYVDQGGGKRKGAFAVYLEPWHADVEAFLELKKNHGKEEARARDLFYALWISDLFMKRVEAGEQWSLFCPDEAPGLVDVYGAEFDALYERYEREGRARKAVPAQQLWLKIVEAQMETGTPYMLYKDAANSKSNQQHLGVLRGSNLCTEILQYTSPDEVAVCNLASIALPRFVRDDVPVAASEDGDSAAHSSGDSSDSSGGSGGSGDCSDALERFDFEALRQVTRFVARSLDSIISTTHYPLPEARNSNLRHRPMGLGVQGLADVFARLQLPFECAAARELNRAIFETIYFGAVEASCELAEELGAHDSFDGSPASRGQLQFDMWGVTPSARWDWESLKARIAQHGLRNSLLVAPMPTASTAQILGNNECFEPVTSNLYARRTLAGEFFLLNPHLQRELQALGLWSREMRDAIIAAGGSVQAFSGLPERLRAVYKTAWEIKQRALIDLAADRGAFIDQSQSLNLFLKEPTFSQVSSMHFHAWRSGLKTGMYYLRTQPATEAIKFTLPSVSRTSAAEQDSGDDERALAAAACALANPEACEMCSS